MDQKAADQLEKVLALAESNHDSEAASAVRKAREILAREGLGFGDLARAATGSLPRRTGFFFSSHRTHSEHQLNELRIKLADLESRFEAQTLQTDMWRARASDLERHFNQQLSEAERWKALARETAEKLWDLGQSIKSDECAPGPPVSDGAKAKTA